MNSYKEYTFTITRSILNDTTVLTIKKTTIKRQVGDMNIREEYLEKGAKLSFYNTTLQGIK